VLEVNQKLHPLLVLKFGGSCLEDIDSFKQTTSIIKRCLKKAKLVVVTSALKGVTDKLIEFYERSNEYGFYCERILNEVSEIHKNIVENLLTTNSEYYNDTINHINKLITEITNLGSVVKLIRPSKILRDNILSYGEKLSTYIMFKYLISLGFNSSFLSSDEVLKTDNNFGNALPLLKETESFVQEKIVPLISSNSTDIVCITGFYGSTKNNKITTLGRGGTDLTAAVIAYSLRQNFKCKVIYWKDVPGFLNADPRIIPKSKLLKTISYLEAKELAYFGSKVLHPLCLDVNEKGGIPSEIRSFKDPSSSNFTSIIKDHPTSEVVIKAISSIARLAIVTIQSGTMISLARTAANLFSLLDAHEINIKFISQSSSENNITFAIDKDDSMKVSYLLRNSELFGKQWFSIKIDNDVSLIALIGPGMMHAPGIAGKIFTILGDNGINVRAIAQGSSEINFTAIIDRKDRKNAIISLYDAFID